jgi:hypothetical protein
MEDAAVLVLVLELAKLCWPNTRFSCSSAHNYLSIEMGFGMDPGTMIMSMTKYLQEVINEFLETFMWGKGVSGKG